MTHHDRQTDGWQPFERVKALSYRLVSWPSESGTQGEADFADRLAALLREIPYFRDHPEDIAVIDSHGAPMAKNVVAVVRGSGTRTLALGGQMLARGLVLARSGDVAAAFAFSGGLKAAHAVLAHGVLVLPLLARLLACTGRDEGFRTSVVRLAVVAYLVAAVAVLVGSLVAVV